MCGIFGIYSNKTSSEIINTVISNLSLLQHRGKDGCGIGYNTIRDNKKYVKIIKKYGLVKDSLINYSVADDLTHSCIGHIKYSTSGKSTKNNKLDLTETNELQPLSGKNINGNSIIIAHNGNIPIIKGFDTQVLLNQILNSETNIENNQNIENTLINIMNNIPAAYCLLIIVNDVLYVMRDRYGIRPLSYGEYNNSVYISSETRALENCENIKEIDSGTIMRIDKNGSHIIYKHPNSVNGICALEILYFMNPKSYINGLTIESIRSTLGIRLSTKEKLVDNNTDDYVVVGVPDSGLIYAKAYAEHLSLQYSQLIEKVNNCSNGEDRTFILINNDERQKACRKKFKYNSENIKNKKIIIIDDTIVRGTVIKTVIDNCKECGAVEIHIRIPAPPVIDICQLGIAIHSKEELIMNNRTINEVINMLDVDSLDYLTVEDLTMFPKDSYMEFFGCGIAPEILNVNIS